MNAFFDIRDKNELRKIESNLTDPIFFLNKAINAIKVLNLFILNFAYSSKNYIIKGI